MEQEYFYNIMYGWIAERNTECEVEHQNGFDFGAFVNHIIASSN